MDIDENPLKWWKHESTRMSFFSQLAKRCLLMHYIPVWLLKEHSVLLVTSLLITDLLKPEKANQFIFLANNLEYPISHVSQDSLYQFITYI